MKQRIKRNDETYWNILSFSGKWKRKQGVWEKVRESENEKLYFGGNLVGTMFLASSELNKAQKQIIENLKGQKFFSMQSLFTFTAGIS